MIYEYGYAFLLGLLSILSPCSLVIIPVLTSQIGSKLKIILKFFLGILITFSILGILSAVTGKLLTNFFGQYLFLFAAIITLIIGIEMLDVFHFKLPNIFSIKNTKNSFLLGLIFGGVSLACVGPLIGAVLAFIVAKADILMGFVMMLFFSVGFIVPFFLFGLLITDKKIYKKISTYSLIIRKIGGIILILVSLFLFFIGFGGLS